MRRRISPRGKARGDRSCGGEGILRAGKLSYSDVTFEVGKLAEAEEVILRHAGELNGDLYTTLLPWAKTLDKGGYPWGPRWLTGRFWNRSSPGPRASTTTTGARYLRKLDSIAEAITDWKGLIPHDQHKEALREKHKRKYDFWGKYEGKEGR